MISYNVIIGDTITKVLIRIFNGMKYGRKCGQIINCLIRLTVSRSTIFGNRNSVVFLSSLLVTFPLSLYRNISKLNKVCEHHFNSVIAFNVTITSIIPFIGFIGIPSLRFPHFSLHILQDRDIGWQSVSTKPIALNLYFTENFIAVIHKPQ